MNIKTGGLVAAFLLDLTIGPFPSTYPHSGIPLVPEMASETALSARPNDLRVLGRSGQITPNVK